MRQNQSIHTLKRKISKRKLAVGFFGVLIESIINREQLFYFLFSSNKARNAYVCRSA